MRIAIGRLWQETNTFNPLPTTFADFEAFGVHRGDDLLAALADVNEPGGMMSVLRAWPERPDLIGLVSLPAWPSGRATPATCERIFAEFDAALDRAGRVDAVLLALHGAMVGDGVPDVEGELLTRLRRRLGPTPVVATLDLHAHVTPAMVEAADALVLYHTAPHVDVFETGERAARVLGRILRDGLRPATAYEQIRAVVPAERANTQDPSSPSFAIRELVQVVERRPGVLAAGLATVQPWLDVPGLCSAAVVVHERHAAEAGRLCRDVAEAFWQARRDYLPWLTDAAEAVRVARAECDPGLVVLSDSADATTSGAPGDSTHVLRELLKHEWPREALVTIVDPTLAGTLSEGGRYRGPIGGKRDAVHSTPIDIDAEVVRTFDAKFTLTGHLGRNLPIDMGRGAVLALRGGVRLILTERTGPHFAPELFRAAGFDPYAAAVLVAKSPCGFRAAYAAKAVRILVVRAPGCAPADFWRYPYSRITRPVWPWDEFGE